MKNQLENKFVNKDMATMAASSAFFAAFRTNKHVTICALEVVEKIELAIFLNIGEHYELPDGYLFTWKEESEHGLVDEPEERYKVVKYYFEY